jgi:hypothetical protein
MKIHLEGAKLFHADGQTDMTNLIVAFHSFANAPKCDLQDVMCEDVEWIEPPQSKFGGYRNRTIARAYHPGLCCMETCRGENINAVVS